MGAVKNLQGRGTPELVWAQAGLPEHLPCLDLDVFAPPGAGVVVVVPHPDDEVLGVGGLLRQLGERDVGVLILAVTDGEASHPDRADELRVRRADERRGALGVLGSDARVVRLGHPDGHVDEALLRRQISAHVGPTDVLLAPWERDGHPDHDACGHAARGLSSRAWSYLVWAWHWAQPCNLPTDRMVQVPMSVDQLQAKHLAVQEYVSQLEGVDPILPEHVLVRLTRSAEVLLAGSC